MTTNVIGIRGFEMEVENYKSNYDVVLVPAVVISYSKRDKHFSFAAGWLNFSITLTFRRK